VFTWVTPTRKPNECYIDSRYTLYDLVKITSRKKEVKMITFYFKIPLLDDYP